MRLLYQPGSIVSRESEPTYRDGDTFAFDAGQGLSEHTAPLMHWSMSSMERQNHHLRQEVRACRGEMIVMPANEPHALKAQERFKMLPGDDTVMSKAGHGARVTVWIRP
jgi:quercetin dioxygenase-like cupin family protein